MTAHQLAHALPGRRKRRGDEANRTDPVRRFSYEVEDRRAQPWRRIGTGTLPFGQAFVAAMMRTAEWLFEVQHRERYDGADRLQRAHLLMFKGLLSKLDFATGRLDPAWDTIAGLGSCHRSTVDRGLDALHHAGFICIVRRTKRVAGAEGQRGPQLAQTSNAFYFDCKARMAPATFRAFWAFLLEELARHGQWLKSKIRTILETFNSEAAPSPRESRVRRVLKRAKAFVDREAAATPPPARTPVERPPGRPECVLVPNPRSRPTSDLAHLQEMLARIGATAFGIDPSDIVPNAGS